MSTGRKKAAKGYARYKKADLVKFATNRGLQVDNTAKRLDRGPTLSDYERALKQADADAVFRFLDLSPEMRNRVYRELLVLRDSYSCHPEILATSRQVYKEGSSLLYVENLIDVRIRVNDGVYCHGRRLGPCDPYAERKGKRLLQWPAFLRRVNHLRISLIELRRPPPYRASSLVSLGNVLHSVCSFLAPSHHLRSLCVNVQCEKSQGLMEDVSLALYPLRLLHTVPRLRIEGAEDDLTLSAAVQHMELGSTENASTTSTKQLLRYYSTSLDLWRFRQSQRLWWPSNVDFFLTRGAMKAFLSHGFYNGRAWDDWFLSYCECVRERLKETSMGQPQYNIDGHVQKLLKCGTDLQLKRLLEAEARSEA